MKGIQSRNAGASSAYVAGTLGGFLPDGPAGGSDKVDTGEADEVIVAIAKTVAELTSHQDGTIRQEAGALLVVTRF